MVVFPPENFKRLLVCLVGDAKLDLGPKKTVVAVHKVVHAILKVRLVVLKVN